MTLTFDQPIDAGSVNLGTITLSDSNSEKWKSLTTPTAGGTVINVGMGYEGSIVVPALRCSYDGSSGSFTYGAGTPVNAWSDFTITEV